MKNRMLTKRQACEILQAQLKNEASSFTAHWRDLGDYILPRRTKFFTSDTNKGDKRNKNIIDPTGTMSARTLRSGMMAGVTSPARPWFRLGFSDNQVSQIPRVKTWLKQVEDGMRSVFSRSNLYKCLPIIYGDMGTFGTGALFVERDLDNVLRFTTFPVGSFYIANDDKLRVRVFYREFQMTVRQIIGQFATDPNDPTKIDWDIVSTQVKTLYDAGNMEAWITVSHLIKPNPEHNPKFLLSKFKKYVSYYYETGTGGTNQQDMAQDKFLSEKGFDYFPVLAPRWEVTGEDVYGTNCPGMTALGDIKQLQLGEKRAAQAIEKIINPAMVAPTSLKGKSASILPGDVTYVDDKDVGKGFREAHKVDPSVLQPIEAKQGQVRSRIQRAFFEDLFLMLAQSDGQMTATEVVERKEEKILALGPVLEQIDQDLLDPLIDIAFQEMMDQGLVPEAPEEIQGAEIKVEYISIMAQAQKLAGIGSIERFVGFVGQVASFKPGALDLVDEDEMVQIYGDLSGAPLNIIKTMDRVNQERADKAAAQQQQAQMEQAGAAVEAAKSLSQTSMDSNSALKQLIS
jgi:hypothetical protein